MRANKLLLLCSSLGVLALLVVAMVQENFLKEWRRIQMTAQARGEELDSRLRQIVVPALHVSDRCVTCHVGMAPGEQGVAGVSILAPHPNVGHDPAAFGCIICHGGQGRATDRADAHGTVPFWPSPMLPREFTSAGCGRCHTHLRVPDLAQLRQGQALIEQYDCLACHRLNRRGGTLRPGGGGMEGPDLSRVGATGYRKDWYDGHLRQRAKAAQGPWVASFAPMAKADREIIEVVLASSVGAPSLVESKALFHSLGCRGCHRVGGGGGDDGPDLTRIGERDPGRLDFAQVPGAPTLANWLAEHLRNPAALVPGSKMPILPLDEQEIRLLELYLLSLRRSDVPEAYWPKDRILAERFGEREFAGDGATLFGSFCAACHGRDGRGMRYPGLPPFPSIANPDFLTLASDAFLTETVRHGRPGRRMAAWDRDGGLTAVEIATVVAHIRRLGGGVGQEPDRKPPRWVEGDPDAGKPLFAGSCAGCHGPEGRGGEGPALHNKVLLGAATDTYLVETIRRGRRGTDMQGFETPTTIRPALARGEIESIVSFLRSWEEKKP
jgi:mono/diheme cytochrome c family protein